MAYVPNSNSVVAFQSNPSSLQAGVSVIGLTPVSPTPASVQVLNPVSLLAVNPNPSSVYVINPVSTLSISTTSTPTSVMLLNGENVIGSVAVLQGTNPWRIGNSSVMTIQGTSPWVIGSVIATIQSSVAVAIVSGSVAVTVTPPANQSVSGTVQAELLSTNASIITVGGGTTGNSSVTVNNIVTGQSSVYLIPGVGVLGSVATLQGTNPWVIANSSVLAFQGTLPWVIQSIVGTYAEDAAHTSGDRGIMTLGVRNDTTASLVSADSEYTPYALDSTGRSIIKPFASDASSVNGVGSVNGAASVILLVAPGTGLRNYLTDFTVSNTGPTTTLVRITAGGASLLATTIAPAGGGSNMIGLATPIAAPPNSPINFAVDTASSVVYGTAYGYRAP